MTNPTLWNQILIWPITNILIAFYKVFEFIRIPGPMGWAVIMLTIVSRVILYPLMRTQLSSARKMASLKPKLDKLTKKHKDNKQALQQAQLNLYREHGVNPAGGCLPLLVQMPILIALYRVFFEVLNNGDVTQVINNINSIVYHSALKLSNLDLTFFGIHLGIKPNQWQTHGIWLLSVPIITGVLQYAQARLMQPAVAGTRDNKQDKEDKKNEKKDEKGKEDMQADMQKQMTLITPIMIGFFSYQFPLGLTLYWNVSGLFGIFQQLKINREVKI